VILEAAMLNVRPGQEREFEAAFRGASPIIAGMPGYDKAWNPQFV
jgi:heme-degrading monooxygenase HmoA